MGGKGRMFGTMIGVLIIGVLNNGLNIIGVSAFWQQVIKVSYSRCSSYRCHS